MRKQLKEIISRSGPSMPVDALGLSSLCLMLVVGLNLTGIS